MLNIKHFAKLETILIIQVNIKVLLIVYVIQNIVDLKRLNYNFIIKELAEEFEGQFTCLDENTEKYEPFQFEQKKNQYKNQ